MLLLSIAKVFAILEKEKLKSENEVLNTNNIINLIVIPCPFFKRRENIHTSFLLYSNDMNTQI